MLHSVKTLKCSVNTIYNIMFNFAAVLASVFVYFPFKVET